MKLLRVLTGFHAGAQLSIEPGVYRIGAHADADIQLIDWQGNDVVLRVDTNGVVTVSPKRDETDADVATAEPGLPIRSLTDLEPVQFGETVLCVGNETPKWPSDVELLSTLLAQPHELRAHGTRFYRHAIAAAVTCALFVSATIGLSLDTAEASHASTLNFTSENAQQIRRALAAAHLDGLYARAIGNTIAVSGIVLNDTDDRAARRILDRFSSTNTIERNYDIAQDVTRSIGDMLGVNGAYVTYLGDARFAVNGPALEKAALETAIARVRDDLGPNITDVVLRTSGPDATTRPIPSYSEMLASNDVRFAQTPDGVKHLFSSSDPMESENAIPR
ncbi:hypothetical protein WS67_01080 [Burkholderia singularis]|uniref:Type III secretion inner membrane protein (YscD,homologous to flagellar export components) n=1 Tax=Burkholderia singularis TaxID=1503053 RepID=A0A118DLZ1_9BURK|nr:MULTISPECIES: hypothetical protein [Burkholderia]AOK29082.1 hypothetical protein AQ611_06215 [Burkholderia sp. Bp7605]KVE24189.1 hypothetical protein WS67_01080 [Burkholderia singularis]